MNFSFFSLPALIAAGAYFFAGIIDSVCGGGGLLTIPALMAIGVPTHFIAGTNQCSALIGASVSAVEFGRNGKLHFRTAILAGLAAIPGGILGAMLNTILPEKYLQIIMIGLLPVIAVLTPLKRETGSENRLHELSPTRIILTCLGIGLVLGAYQGFYGPGGGMFFILGFTVLVRLDLITAVGNTKIVSICAGLTSALTFVLKGLVVWKIALIATIFSILGNVIGAKLTVKKGAKIVRPLMLVMLAALLIYVIRQLVLG